MTVRDTTLSTLATATPRVRASHLASRISKLPQAFTLIEVLIVLAIISLVVAIGVPVFNLLTGARSVEAGRNVVAAALGQARTIAVNEGKYAGIMFYVDPATERTAMSIVIVSDPKSGLEDPDPYDKYKTWVAGQQYDAPTFDPTTKLPNRGDRVIGLTADADATYRGSLYGASPLASDFLKYFGNYRPTVRAFRCITQHTSNTTSGVRPPRNGPYGTYAGSAAAPQQYPGNNASGSASPPTAESTVSSFGNANWGVDNQNNLTRYGTGEQTLLPKGIGVQVIIQPTLRTPTATFNERYLRTGIIMFDPQGRLTTTKNMSLATTDALGNYLALQSDAQRIACGVGLVLYDDTAFRAVAGANGLPNSQSDYLYQVAPGNGYAIRSTFNNIFADQPSAAATGETDEEAWLDNNTTPLLVNRYSGSLSETD